MPKLPARLSRWLRSSYPDAPWHAETTDAPEEAMDTVETAEKIAEEPPSEESSLEEETVWRVNRPPSEIEDG